MRYSEKIEEILKSIGIIYLDNDIEIFYFLFCWLAQKNQFVDFEVAPNDKLEMEYFINNGEQGFKTPLEAIVGYINKEVNK